VPSPARGRDDGSERREERILGRPLTSGDAREDTNRARQLAAIILLEPKLDESYQRYEANI